MQVAFKNIAMIAMILHHTYMPCSNVSSEAGSVAASHKLVTGALFSSFAGDAVSIRSIYASLPLCTRLFLC